MIIADYKPEHGKEILDGKMNKGAPHHISKYLDFAESLCVPGQSFSAIDNGHLIACAGIIKEQELVRIQAAVRADWPEAQRFAEFLGLENEGLMRKYGPDGSDYFRFAKVF